MENTGKEVEWEGEIKEIEIETSDMKRGDMTGMIEVGKNEIEVECGIIALGMKEGGMKDCGLNEVGLTG